MLVESVREPATRHAQRVASPLREIDEIPLAVVDHCLGMVPVENRFHLLYLGFLRHVDIHEVPSVSSKGDKIDDRLLLV